ncbi:SDR family NAD(P)-dependent oxidoreductase, partial [Escherichia coli]|uniref:SDR family NAD(P)-dependent oxidoreductase n=1 Tax=Escherichia coli TaxID=562 RepID=UPI0032E3EB87
MNAKVALVTGASSGIGEATALSLRKAGFVVYAAARRTARMTSLREVGVNTIALDVTDEASVTNAVDM